MSEDEKVAGDIIALDPSATIPTAKTDLIYNGSLQELVNNGNSNIGNFLYSLDKKIWTNKVPSASEPGEYTIYYKYSEIMGENDFKKNKCINK